MNIQTDCEMLLLTALEHYATKHNISRENAIDIFHKHQVFENILVQHEYLHQVSIQEIDEYVEKLINKSNNELVVFHGSCFRFDKIDLKKSHNWRDFGKGFYTTVLQKQSENWAFHRALRENTKKYYVYTYLFTENSEMKVKRFPVVNNP